MTPAERVGRRSQFLVTKASAHVIVGCGAMTASDKSRRTLAEVIFFSQLEEYSAGLPAALEKLVRRTIFLLHGLCCTC